MSQKVLYHSQVLKVDLDLLLLTACLTNRALSKIKSWRI
jgi:hypothetical protein